MALYYPGKAYDKPGPFFLIRHKHMVKAPDYERQEGQRQCFTQSAPRINVGKTVRQQNIQSRSQNACIAGRSHGLQHLINNRDRSDIGQENKSLIGQGKRYPQQPQESRDIQEEIRIHAVQITVPCQRFRENNHWELPVQHTVLQPFDAKQMIAYIVRLGKGLDKQRHGRIQAKTCQNQEGNLSFPAGRMLFFVGRKEYPGHSQKDYQNHKVRGIPVKSSLGNQGHGVQYQASHSLIVNADMKLLGILIQSKSIISGSLHSIRAFQTPLGHLRSVVPHFNNIIR